MNYAEVFFGLFVLVTMAFLFVTINLGVYRRANTRLNEKRDDLIDERNELLEGTTKQHTEMCKLRDEVEAYSRQIENNRERHQQQQAKLRDDNVELLQRVDELDKLNQDRIVELNYSDKENRQQQWQQQDDIYKLVEEAKHARASDKATLDATRADLLSALDANNELKKMVRDHKSTVEDYSERNKELRDEYEKQKAHYKDLRDAHEALNTRLNASSAELLGNGTGAGFVDHENGNRVYYLVIRPDEIDSPTYLSWSDAQLGMLLRRHINAYSDQEVAGAEDTLVSTAGAAMHLLAWMAHRGMYSMSIPAGILVPEDEAVTGVNELRIDVVWKGEELPSNQRPTRELIDDRDAEIRGLKNHVETLKESLQNSKKSGDDWFIACGKIKAAVHDALGRVADERYDHKHSTASIIADIKCMSRKLKGLDTGRRTIDESLIPEAAEHIAQLSTVDAAKHVMEAYQAAEDGIAERNGLQEDGVAAYEELVRALHDVFGRTGEARHVHNYTPEKFAKEIKYLGDAIRNQEALFEERDKTMAKATGLNIEEPTWEQVIDHVANQHLHLKYANSKITAFSVEAKRLSELLPFTAQAGDSVIEHAITGAQAYIEDLLNEKRQYEQNAEEAARRGS